MPRAGAATCVSEASTRLLSYRLAAERWIPSGTLWPSTNTLSFVPIPLRVGRCRRPVFARAKVPSVKASLRLSCLCRPRPRGMHPRGHVRRPRLPAPASDANNSHSAEEGQGKPVDHAPVRRIQRISSRHARSSARGRPPFGFAFGNSGAIFAHRASVSSGFIHTSRGERNLPLKRAIQSLGRASRVDRRRSDGTEASSGARLPNTRSQEGGQPHACRTHPRHALATGGACMSGIPLRRCSRGDHRRAQ